MIRSLGQKSAPGYHAALSTHTDRVKGVLSIPRRFCADRAEVFSLQMRNGSVDVHETEVVGWKTSTSARLLLILLSLSSIHDLDDIDYYTRRSFCLPQSCISQMLALSKSESLLQRPYLPFDISSSHPTALPLGSLRAILFRQLSRLPLQQRKRILHVVSGRRAGPARQQRVNTKRSVHRQDGFLGRIGQCLQRGLQCCRLDARCVESL